MRRRIAVAVALGAALVATGFGIGWFAHDPKMSASAYGQMRLAAVQQHLDEAEPGFILLAGDSNAELRSSADTLCGSRIINAGVSGVTTQAYRKLLAGLTLPVRSQAVVLTIGTNNLNLKKSPRSPRAAGQFEDDVAAIVAELRTGTETVLVTALPPIDRNVADRMDAPAVGDYSARLSVLCRKIGCSFVDPFASLRDGSSGFALPGVSRDGVHVARYKPTLNAITALLCPDEVGRSLTPTSGAAVAP